MSVPNVPQQPVGQSTPEIQQPQSNDEAIGQFARGFLDDLDKNTDPDVIERDDEAPVQEDAPPVEAEAQPEVQEAETPTPEPTEPMAEVEMEGKKALVPEWVKHRVMADKDYRQKTMEVAATKKQLEQLTATAAQIAQQAQQMAPYHAQLHAMDNHAQYLQSLLQSRELADDPLQYNRVQGELAILLRNRDAFDQRLQQQSSYLSAQQQKLLVDKLALDAPKLFEEFPELQKPESRQKLASYVQEAGLPPEALNFLNYSAAGTKLAWKAHQYDQMVADQTKARAKLQEKTKTLPSATQSSRAPDKGAQNKSLREQWKKGGGSINDPAFDQLLRNTIRR
jgi:hypothetical protein